MILSFILKCKLSNTLFLFCLSSLRGFTGGGKMEEPKVEKDDVINIFSVASGHLYERFLRSVSDEEETTVTSTRTRAMVPV